MKVILLIIMMITLTGCGHDPYDIPEEVFINFNENKYEVFSDIYVEDLIHDTNVIYKNKAISSDVIGKKKVTIDFTYKGKYYKKDVNYDIVDVTSPVFISYYGSTTVLVNQDIYPCDDAVYADDYDNLPTCVIDGYFDLTTPGTYNVQYLLKDASNNETRKNLKIKVVEKYK